MSIEIKSIRLNAGNPESISLWSMLKKSNTDHKSLFIEASSKEISEYVSERLIKMILNDFEETKKKAQQI